MEERHIFSSWKALTPCYKYDSERSGWLPYIPTKNPDSMVQAKTPMRVASYNILFGSPFPKSMVASLSTDAPRFEYIVNTVIPEERSDIFGLNEVIPEFLDILLASQFVRAGYFISHISSDLRGYGSVILSRFRFASISNKRKCIAFFPSNDDAGGICVGSLHLIANEDRAKEEYRREELTEVVQLLKTLREGQSTAVQWATAGRWPTSQLVENQKNYNSREFFDQVLSSSLRRSNVVILGDMNFHNLGETDLVYELGLQDVWLNLRGLEDKGYTWDPVKNRFINLILPFDNRRMRLDRVLVHKDSENLQFTDIEIFANKSIGKSRLCCFPVFPSDHFGLRTVMIFHSEPKKNDKSRMQEPFDYTRHRHKILDGRDPHSTGFSTVKTIIIKRIVAAVIFAIITIGGTGAVIWWVYILLSKSKK